MTYVRALSKRLPHYQTFDEPYVLMEDEGYEFSHPPTVEDYAGPQICPEDPPHHLCAASP